jgi:hypothetical protein
MFSCKHNVCGLPVAGFRRVSPCIAAVSKAHEQSDSTEGDDEDEATGKSSTVFGL